MSTTGQDANTPSTSKTGLFAALRGLFPSKGRSAISYNTSACRPIFLVALVIALCALAYTAVPALAAGLEKPEVGAPSEVKAASATLTGTLSPKSPGEANSTYEFLYKASTTGECKGESKAPATPGESAGSEAEAVSAPVTGLKPGVEYAVCLVVHNVSKTEEPVSTAVSFVTVPIPTTEAASPVGSTTATFNGKLSPLNATVATEYFFFYNLGEEAVCTDERETAPHESAGTGAGSKTVSTAVTELEPNQKYTVCLDSANAFGSEEDPSLPPVHFTTKPAPPAVESESAPSVAAHEATLEAQINANNEETTYSFEYASSEAALGTASATKLPAVPGPALGASFGPQAVSVSTGPVLKQVTTYYYRVIATNGAGTTTDPTIESFKTLPEAPTTTKPTGITASAAVLHGILNPNAPGEAGTYEFLYKESPSECAGGTPTTQEAMTGAQGQEAKPAEITGLTPGVQYTFCLVENGAGETVMGAPVTFRALPVPPVIAPETEFSSEVTSTSAILGGEVNPGGGETSYYFEYDTSPYAGGATHGKRSSEAVLNGTDNNPHPASTLVQGLEPATTYHFRIVVTNSAGTEYGLDHTFTTHATGGEFKLLDDRAWEQVSPIDKHGAVIEAMWKSGGVIQAAEDGSAITYFTRSPVTADPEGNPGPGDAQVLSTRGSDGWSSRDIAAPHEVPVGTPPIENYAEYLAFSPDLSRGVVFRAKETEIPLSPAASQHTIYLREGLRESGPPQYVPLVNDSNVLPGTHYGSLESPYFEGASSNLEHVVFTGVGAALTKGGGPFGLYEWTGGVLQPVSVLPKGEWSERATLGSQAQGGSGYDDDVRNAVSSDGQKVFWQNVQEPKHLYMRDTATEKTVQLDLPQEEVVPVEAYPGAEFQYATPDGSKVYFKDTERLTRDATAEEGEGGVRAKPELYEYNTVTNSLTDLTPNPAGTTSVDIKGTVEVSENGEYIYFVADGSLDGAPVGECDETGASPSATCNLYVAHVEGGKVSTGLVSVLSQADENDWQAFLTDLTSRISPNGRFLAFMSERSLTGYDNRDAVSGVADQEVFVYDAQTGHISCASCDPTGARPHGVYDAGSGFEGEEGLGLLVDRPALWEGRWLAGNVPGWTDFRTEGGDFYQSRYLSDEGRLFFNAADALVPQDTNRKEDVYEYEPEGVGPQAARCGPGSDSGSEVYKPGSVVEVEGRRVEEGAGCVGLISSGESSHESAFVDANEKGAGGEEGEDVFFLTAAKLSPQDVDTAFDVYDAHICSSATPCASAAAVSPACTTTDSCRVAPAAQPSLYGAPSSATFAGAGNPASTLAPKKVTKKTVKCKKGDTKNKKGKCVPKKKKKTKRAKKSAHTDRRASR